MNMMINMSWPHTRQEVRFRASHPPVFLECPLSSLLAALVVASTVVAAPPVPAGRWVSEAAEDLGNGSFATRDFTFTDKTWTLVFTIFSDRDLKKPLVAVDIEGTWKTTAPSKSVEGANEATFNFSKRRIILKDANAAKGFGMDGCGLEVGKPKDVSKTGCSFVLPVEKAPREYDLLKAEPNAVYLGARPPDGNLGTEDRRPTALGPKLVKK